MRRGQRWRTVAVAARSRPARAAGWTLAAVLGLAAAVAYAVALWRAPGWMHATTAQDRYNARVLVISVGGAIVVGTGLLYTARGYRLSRRGQVTDRFTVALERLGSAELYVRIGGVHALEHVMHDSADHHHDVIEVLAAFIRDRAPRRGRQVWHPVAGSVPDPGLPPEPAPDIQAALTALARRPHRPERQPIGLPDLHLVGAYLGDADGLAGADLGGADLTGGELSDADLTNANLIHADLTNANLIHANLTDANLIYANLTGARLGYANLTGGDLRGANLTGALLLGANLTNADLRGANLTGAYLHGANLTNADLRDANLTNADLELADLTNANLSRADLTDALLSGARWPKDAALPEGWRRDDGGYLERTESGPGGSGT